MKFVLLFMLYVLIGSITTFLFSYLLYVQDHLIKKGDHFSYSLRIGLVETCEDFLSPQVDGDILLFAVFVSIWPIMAAISVIMVIVGILYYLVLNILEKLKVVAERGMDKYNDADEVESKFVTKPAIKPGKQKTPKKTKSYRSRK